MYNTESKLKYPSVGVYCRVATKEQLVSKKTTSNKNKAKPTITIGDKSYIMPKGLMNPRYEYKSRFDVHMFLKEKINNLQ